MLDKNLNALDDKLTEVTGGNRNEDDDNDNIDYTGGDANDVLYRCCGVSICVSAKIINIMAF